MTGDDAKALQFARSELDRTGDHIWRPLVVLLALITGDLEQARAELRRLEPAVLAPQPDITRMVPMKVLLAAGLLEAEDQTAQADRLLHAVLVRLRPPQEGHDPAADKLMRAQALAMLDRADEAVAELEAAWLGVPHPLRLRPLHAPRPLPGFRVAAGPPPLSGLAHGNRGRQP